MLLIQQFYLKILNFEWQVLVLVLHNIAPINTDSGTSTSENSKGAALNS